MEDDKAIELNEALPDNVLNLKIKDTNINVDGDIVSLIDLEKIFFLHKLSCDPSFIASTLNIDVKKIDRIIHSQKFTSIVSEYLSEYQLGNAGETPEALTLRYKEFLQEVFTATRVSVGMHIRDAIENGRPIKQNLLYIDQTRKIMSMEFALHGLPVNLTGVIHATKKSSQDKTQEELVDNIKKMVNTLDEVKQKSFSPSDMIEGEVVKEENNITTNEKKEDEIII